MATTSETQDDEYRAFLANGEVRLQRCADCGYVRPPTRWICPQCLSETWQWVAVSGSGVVEALVWYIQPVDARFTEVPYNVALVKLDEGVRLTANINGVAFGALKVGQRVRPDIGTGRQGNMVLNFRCA
jgi:uncharacterized OB-fold protein